MFHPLVRVYVGSFLGFFAFESYCATRRITWDGGVDRFAQLNVKRETENDWEKAFFPDKDYTWRRGGEIEVGLPK